MSNELFYICIILFGDTWNEWQSFFVYVYINYLIKGSTIMLTQIISLKTITNNPNNTNKLWVKLGWLYLCPWLKVFGA